MQKTTVYFTNVKNNVTYHLQFVRLGRRNNNKNIELNMIFAHRGQV